MDNFVKKFRDKFYDKLKIEGNPSDGFVLLTMKEKPADLFHAGEKTKRAQHIYTPEAAREVAYALIATADVAEAK